MHELGLAIAIVDVAADEAAKLGSGRVTGVRLKVGALAGVVKDALLFSFDVATAGTPLEGARLYIEDVPVVVWCPSCNAERMLADAAVRRCPACNAVTPRLMRGEELQVTGLEITET